MVDKPWKADKQGNHRAVVGVTKVAANSNFLVAELISRRPDLCNDTKKIVIIDADTGEDI